MILLKLILNMVLEEIKIMLKEFLFFFNKNILNIFNFFLFILLKNLFHLHAFKKR